MYTKKNRLFTTVAVVALFVVSTPLAAHQQWLMPNFFSHAVVDDNAEAWLSFDHTFGDQRFYASSAPGVYYQWWIVSPDNRKKSIPFLFVGKTRVVGEVELTDPGTYRLEGEEPNMVWTRLQVGDAKVWQPGPRSQFKGQEIIESKIYFAKALAYVSMGPVSSAPPSATGDPLELVFQQHPNGLEAGRSFSVSVLSFGKPLAEREVKFYSGQSEGHDPTSTCSTDAKGLCELTAASTGRYLLTTELKGPTPDDPNTDGFSYRVSVTVEVAAAAKE